MKLRTSLLYSFAEKYTLLVLNTAGTMALARLLTPDETGVYALAAVLVGLVQVVRDFGIGPYLIQERELNPEKLRAALAASVCVAWSLALLVLLASLPVARFYHEPRLSVVLQLLAMNFLLMPFSAIVLPYLRRQMRFRAIFFINTCQCLAQVLSSVWLAMHGYRHLSLAWGTVAGSMATFAATACLRPAEIPWRPALRGMRTILSFGTVSTAGTVIDEAGVAAPDLIIGKAMETVAVGIYSKAVGVVNVFNQLVTAAISPVVFPMFSAQVRAGDDLRLAYLRTVSYMSALALPFFGATALMAPAVVRVLYGPQWQATVPLIRIICIGAAVYSTFNMARYLLLAAGEVGQQARLDALSVPVRVIAVLAAAPFGLVWVGWAVVLGYACRSVLTYLYLKRLVHLRLSHLWAALRRSCLVTVVSLAGPATVLLWWPEKNALLQLATAASTGCILWLLSVRFFGHEWAAECGSARRKAMALLQR